MASQYKLIALQIQETLRKDVYIIRVYYLQKEAEDEAEAKAQAHDVEEPTNNSPQRDYGGAAKSNADRAVRILFKLTSYCLFTSHTITTYGVNTTTTATHSNVCLVFLASEIHSHSHTL